MQAATITATDDRKPDDAAPDRSNDRMAAMAFLLDDNTEASLRGGLVEQLNSINIRRGGIKGAIRTLRMETAPRVLLVDISGVEDDPVKALDDLAAVCPPDVKVIVLGDRSDIEFYRLVTRRLGVDEYLRKPLTRDAVSSLVGPYIAGAEPEQERNRGGRVIAVCGARGGVGSTTIAVNLALQISELTRSHVALFDMHMRGGHAAMMLGVQPNTGLRAALEDPEHVDGLLLDRVAIAINDRLRLIAAEEPLDSEPSITTAGVSRIFKLLRQRFNVLIVDMPMPPDAAQREALLLARQAIIVMTPDLASLRDAQHLKRYVNTQIGAGRALTVLNRSSMPGGLNLSMIQQALDAKPEFSIPDMPKACNVAANLGRPLLRENATLRRCLASLTREITGVDVRIGASRFAKLLGKS